MNRNDRRIVGLVMVAHAMVHTYELSIPILLSIWLVEFPVTEATLGVIVTAGMALFGIGALPGGVLTDRFGSQRLILLCLAGMGGSFVILGAASSVPAIAVALLLWGVAASVYHPAGLSLISKGVSQRGRAFAFHGMAGNVGIALGPLLTALLLIVFDWNTVVLVLALPAVGAVLLAFAVDIDETAAVSAQADGGDARAEGSPSSIGEFLATSRILFSGAFIAVFGAVMFSGLYYRGVLTFLPEVLSELSTFRTIAIGDQALEPSRYLYSGLLMVGIAGQYVGGWLTDRAPVEWGIAVAFAALAAIALVFIAAAEAGPVGLIGVSVVLGFALFVVQPLYQATVAEYSPPETRGLTYGYTYLGVFGVGSLGAAVAGVVLTYATSAVLFVVLAAFAACASALGVYLGLNRSG